MNAFLMQFAAASSSAASALISAAWQGILLALAVWLILRAIPSLSAAARSFIWTAVFLLIALLHIAPLAFPHPSHAAEPQLHASPYWSIALGILWLSASLFRAVQLLWGALHLRRLLRDATPIEAPASVKSLLRVDRRTVRLCASDAVARPCVIGFFRPRILVPPSLLRALSEAELNQVVLHEMQHLHRRDDWANLFQKIALVLFPLNPALLWVEHRLCTERELACDDRVLQSGVGRKAYALCLAHLAEFALLRRGYALMLGAWERRPELVRRIQRILATPGRDLGRKPAFAVAGSVVAGALACTIALAHAPKLVSFAPTIQPSSAEIFAHRGQALNPAALSQAVGGSPQMVRAVMPSLRAVPAKQPAIKQAVVRHHRKPKAPMTRLAELRTPPPPQADSSMLVMTAWSSVDASSQTQNLMFIRQFQATQPIPIVRAIYLVPTPTGWLIIKI